MTDLPIDISVPLAEDYPVWPGDPAVELRPFLSRAAGDPANASRLACSVHAGTHVDAPRHFLDDGQGVDALPLDVLIGQAFVADLRGSRRIGPDELAAAGVPADASRLLLRTDNSSFWRERPQRFHEEFAALTVEGAEWVVARGIRLVGIDYHSIQLFADLGPRTHETLLADRVVIVEALDLGHVEPGRYRLVCLPLRLVGADGAPARAILIPNP